MLTKIIVIAISAVMVWTMTYGIAEIYLKDKSLTLASRMRSYFLGIVGALVISVMFGFAAAAGREPGDFEDSTHITVTEYIPGLPIQRRNEIIRNAFLVSILPSILGIYCALREHKPPPLRT